MSSSAASSSGSSSGSSSASSSSSSSESDRESDREPDRESPQPQTGAKRKRTGKQRAELKAAALAAASAGGATAGASGSGAGQEGGQREGMEVDQEEPEVVEEVVDLEGIKKRAPQALKSLLTILKKSKISETQRLIKKLKFLRSKTNGVSTAEITDLESQLSLLKLLHPTSLTLPLLHLKLSKHPSLRSTPASVLSNLLPPTPSPAPSADTGAAQTKLENRLFSGKGVSEAVKGVVGWCVGEEGGSLRVVKSLPGRGVGRGVVVGGKKSGTSEREGEGKKQGEDGRKESGKQEKEGKKGKKAVMEGEEEEMDEDAAVDAAGWESGSLGGDDDDSGDEDEDVGGDYPGLAPASSASSSSPPPPPSKKSKPPPTPTKSNQKPTPIPKQITSSLFLPSLSAGYTMGDAGEFSDPEEDERRDAKKGTGVVERKNRRGQRERKAIWEKKYGKNANHVKTQALEDRKLEMAQGFLQAQGGKYVSKKSGGAVGDAGWGVRSAGASTVAATYPARAERVERVEREKVVEKPAVPEKAVHPSWEAARLRKEKELKMQNAPVVKAKKIVFD